MAEEDGVLGNLPRSRPGRRSSKRAQAGGGPAAKRSGGAGAKAAPAKRSSAAGAKAAPAKASGSRPAKRSAAKPRAAGQRSAGQRSAKPRAAGASAKTAPSSTPPPAERDHGDPVTEVVRAAGRLAGNGAKAAESVARELFRRLPRP